MDDTGPAAGRPMLDDRFELVERIGSGGMADIWRARDTRLGRDVAVKILAGPSARNATMRRRIEREARALAALSHPNIVSVYDYGEAEGPSGDVQPYVVMELVDGSDLHAHIDRDGALDADESAAILRAVLAGVAYAHDSGIVHGDLKPANIILGPNGPKVGDFGVARILAEETGTTTLAATPSFAAPEVLRGGRPTQSSDIYSAGCVAFQMLTGRPPYEGGNAWDVATKHLEAPIPSVRDARQDVSPELDGVIRAAMEKDPRRRHTSAEAFAAAIDSAPAAPSPATIPVQAVAAPNSPPGTEVLTGRPDLAAVALLGPLAQWGERARARMSGGWARAQRSPSLLLLVLVTIFGVLALVFFATGNDGDELAIVPDIRGMESSTGAARLRTAGFKTDITYRAVTTGTPDIVLETIPAQGTQVEPGAEIHVIASALARTPAPSPVSNNDGDRGRGRDNKPDKDDN
ncbi:MAG: protein kinase domain-containing protein [Actinomycetota bacterium]